MNKQEKINRDIFKALAFHNKALENLNDAFFEHLENQGKINESSVKFMGIMSDLLEEIGNIGTPKGGEKK